MVLAALVLALGLVLLFWWPLVPGKRASLPSPVPTTSPTPDPMLEIRVDLTLASQMPVELEVPARRYLRVMLPDRAPAAAYQWTVATSMNTEPWRQITPLPPPNRPALAAAECAVLYEAWRSFVETIDESSVAESRQVLDRALSETPQACSNLRRTVQDQLRYQQSIGDGIGLAPGAEALLTIEKREPQTGTVLRNWKVKLQAVGPEPDWAFPNEEAWIVAETARDVAAIALSRTGRTPEGLQVRDQPMSGGHSLTIVARGGAVLEAFPIDGDESVWSPKSFVGLAKALLERAPQQASAEPDRAPPGGSVLKTLLAADTATLEATNRQVSARLARTPHDSRAHEEAALLLATFALREAAGSFTDTRRELCAITAHLALADAGRAAGAASIAGPVAEIALDALAGREIPALKRLERLEAPAEEAEALASWRRSIILRITSDWRVVRQPQAATPAEKLAYLRALLVSRTDGHALDFYGEMGSMPEALWLRPFAMQARTVEATHAIVSSLLASELTEAAHVMGLAGASVSPAAIADALANTRGNVARLEAGAPVEVLPRATWARQAERHLANAVRATDTGLGASLGVEEAALQIRRQTKDLERLPLVAIALQERAFERFVAARRPNSGPVGIPMSQTQSCNNLARHLQKRPESTTASSWQMLVRVCSGASLKGQLPLWQLWFSPAILPGTAYDSEVRLLAFDVAHRQSLPHLEELRSFKHYDYTLFRNYVQRRYGRELTGKDFAAEYGRLADYHHGALNAWAYLERDNDAEHLRLLNRMCQIEAQDCLRLGEILAARNRAAEAVQALERAVASARDRVGVAGGVEWLVDHYVDRGNVRRAREIASTAAETYSGAGLQTLAQLHERLGEFDEAEGLYQAMRTRYQRDGALQAFYLRYRQRHGAGRYGLEAEAAMKALFPKGYERVSVSDLDALTRTREYAARGVEGAMFQNEWDISERHRRLGLRLGDRIVAVDGFRVRDWNQYAALRSFSDNPRLTLIVWRGGRHFTLEGPFERRSFAPAPGGSAKR